jgi:hypothetical protein
VLGPLLPVLLGSVGSLARVSTNLPPTPRRQSPSAAAKH